MLDNVAIPVMGTQRLPLPQEWILMHEQHAEGGAA